MDRQKENGKRGVRSKPIKYFGLSRDENPNRICDGRKLYILYLRGNYILSPEYGTMDRI